MIAQDIGGVKARHKRASNPESYTPAQRGLDLRAVPSAVTPLGRNAELVRLLRGR